MSELKDTLFGTTPENNEVFDLNKSSPSNEIEGQVTLGEAYEPVLGEFTDDLPPSPTPEELIRDSMTAVERMKQEIAEENENLNDRFAKQKIKDEAIPVTKRRPVYVIGVLSSAASLVFMSIALLITVNTSPIGAFAAIRLSPIMLLFLGAEIIYAVLRKHSLRIKLDIRSIIIITALMVVSSLLSVVSVIATSGTGERTYAEQRIQNMLANDLRDAIAKDFIKSVDIETQLFGDSAEMYTSPADLTNGDIINLTVNFFDAQMTIREFANDCKDIISGINTLPYNFGTIVFVADDPVNHYVLSIDWHYQAGFSADKLAGMVNYYGTDISVADIPDAVDDEDE